MASVKFNSIDNLHLSSKFHCVKQRNTEKRKIPYLLKTTSRQTSKTTKQNKTKKTKKTHTCQNLKFWSGVWHELEQFQNPKIFSCILFCARLERMAFCVQRIRYYEKLNNVLLHTFAPLCAECEVDLACYQPQLVMSYSYIRIIQVSMNSEKQNCCQFL